MTFSFANAAPLTLRETLCCGQAFRWVENADGSFTGVVEGCLATVRHAADTLDVEVSASSRDAAPCQAGFWENYFALDIDYAALHRAYSRNATLAKCVAFAPGIRVLRQDFFETLVSFIISQNNNIPRIKGIVERLCDNFGEPIGAGPDGKTRHAFPSPAFLASLDLADLACLRAGYRDKGILDAARRVADGRLDPLALRGLETSAAREAVLGVYGAGPKVADCVLLFGLGRFEAFPVDVWIRRAMASLFPRGLPKCARATAGIAQQYIFNYARQRRSCE